jgi:hypothetical protein
MSCREHFKRANAVTQKQTSAWCIQSIKDLQNTQKAIESNFWPTVDVADEAALGHCSDYYEAVTPVECEGRARVVNESAEPVYAMSGRH